MLALVQLPKLTLANFFVRGIETFSEMLVSIRRIEIFLNLPEPAVRESQAPAQESGAGKEADDAPVRVLLRGGSFEWEVSPGFPRAPNARISRSSSFQLILCSGQSKGTGRFSDTFRCRRFSCVWVLKPDER